MARDDLRKLSKALHESRFGFMSRGEHELEEIYALVKASYPELCDDKYLCAQNCASGQQRPEWRHTVRTVLNRLKTGTGAVEPGERRGLWRFL